MTRTGKGPLQVRADRLAAQVDETDWVRNIKSHLDRASSSGAQVIAMVPFEMVPFEWYVEPYM